MKQIKLERLNDEIYFRKCDLFDNESFNQCDCTRTKYRKENWKRIYSCEQHGIHYYCAKHKDQELQFRLSQNSAIEKLVLWCPKCEKEIEIGREDELFRLCKEKLLSYEIATQKEAKNKTNISDYWIKTNIEKDKDNDTVVVIYIGNKNTTPKAQFFIKPEKLQLTFDHKDLDPATIISKIEVTLRDRALIHQYDDVKKEKQNE